jgi:aminoglycoside phosphotransferase (APT) family kinase protein
MNAGGLGDQLNELLTEALHEPATITDLNRLPAGASKETWSFAVETADGSTRRLVLRRDRAVSAESTMLLEAALLEAAERAGVPVPRVVSSGVGGPLERPYLVTEFVDGETIPRRILRDDRFAEARAGFARQCGTILAAVHRISAEAIPGLRGGDPLAQLRRQVDQLGQSHPAFELAFRWLQGMRPVRGADGVVHGDFRNGNLIVDEKGIGAVLDWELAHRGDPIEDLGWLCVKAWRFGGSGPVGGMGSIEDLLSGYAAGGGGSVDMAALDWWVVFGTLRWGVICIAQAMTHLAGVVRSVELAAIGRRVCEVEWDLLQLLDAAEQPGDLVVADHPVRHESPIPLEESAGPPHDVPSLVQLLVAVGEFLESDVLAATEGRVRFHARVAANVVAMAAREVELGAGQAAAHAVRLERLGVANEAELAAAIRRGAFDDRMAALRQSVRATVADKLAVAHPGYTDGATGER